jgi:hypothetical protein
MKKVGTRKVAVEHIPCVRAGSVASAMGLDAEKNERGTWMLTSRIRALGAGAGLILAAVALAPTKAGATTYTYTETINSTTATCGSGCFLLAVYSPFTGTTGPTLKAGDIVDLNVTFSTPFTVGAATGASAIFGAVLDTNYYNCAGVNLPACLPETSDLATSTETILGENAGGPTIVTGDNFSNPGFYVAFAYANGPDPGFTVTGFDATLNIVNSDPFPVTAVAIESELVSSPTPEPGTIVLTFSGLGLLFALRKRFRLGVGQAC